MAKLEKIAQINLTGELDKKKTKILLKFFIFFFLFSFLIFNWNNLSWAFNYHFLVSAFSDLVSGRPSTKPESSQETEGFIHTAAVKYTEKENGIFIPKVQIQAPLIFSSSDDQGDITASLKNGVVHYPHSALPGERGEVIILGHTAPSDWPETGYYSVFNKLIELEEGDEVFVYFQNREYCYKVFEKSFVKEGEKPSASLLTNSESVLVLLGCWPPGKRDQRIVIKAEEII